MTIKMTNKIPGLFVGAWISKVLKMIITKMSQNSKLYCGISKSCNTMQEKKVKNLMNICPYFCDLVKIDYRLILNK